MTSQELSRNQRIGVLLICSMSLLIVGLDITAVNVALPSIGDQLHAELSGCSGRSRLHAGDGQPAACSPARWPTASAASGRCPSGSASSLWPQCCAASPPPSSCSSRSACFRRIGASMLNPVAMSIITNTFTDPRERAQAVGVWGAVFGVSMALGPIVGGALVVTGRLASGSSDQRPDRPRGDRADRALRPRVRAPRPRRFDPVGQILVVVLLASVTYGIIEAPECRLDLAADRRRLRGRRLRCSACSSTSRAGTSR